MKQAVKEVVADEPATEHAIIMRHIKAFRENDREAVVADYSNDAVLITREATYTGKTAILGFFESLFAHFPKSHTDFTLHQISVYDNMAFIIWQATTPTLTVMMGTDTFILDGGKIARQTFAAHMKYH